MDQQNQNSAGLISKEQIFGSLQKLVADNEMFGKLDDAERARLRASFLVKYAQTTAEDDYFLRYGDFKFFTELFWTDLLWLEKVDFIDIAVKRQIVEAILLNFDVKQKICWFIHSKCFTSDDYRVLFLQTRDAFLESSAFIGFSDEGEPYSIKEAIAEIKLINSRGKDSMEVAQFMQKVKKVLALEGDEYATHFFPCQSEDFLRELFALCEFFLYTKAEDAEEVVEIFLFPERAKEIRELIKARKEIPAPKIIAMPEDTNNSAKNVGSNPTPIKPSYAEIRAKVDAVFPKDKAGVYDDLDGVLMALDKAAQKYNDPKIASLYYFDENEGSFKWNV